jgi:hypothetical protein
VALTQDVITLRLELPKLCVGSSTASPPPVTIMFVSTLLAASLGGAPAALPETGAPEVQDCVKKGLKWLVAQQSSEGTWTGRQGFFTAASTAYAGLALLMEGSTLQEGQYAPNLRQAVAWFEKIAQPNGLLVPVNEQSEPGGVYIASHTAALLFLTSAYDTDDDAGRRKRLRPVLYNAVQFAVQAQTRRGGWGGVTASATYDFDDSALTANMLQALLIAEKAGILVPRDSCEKAVKYLLDATNSDGDVHYTLANESGTGPYCTAITAATLSMTGRKPRALASAVVCTKRTAVSIGIKYGLEVSFHSGMLHEYLATARIAHALGDFGHQMLDPGTKEADLLRWSPYRERLFRYLRHNQTIDGSWPDIIAGPSYSTALTLIMLQLDNNYLPAFGR